MKKILCKIKRQKTNIFLSLVFAIFISIGCYFINNCPYPFWDKLGLYSKLEFLLRNLASSDFDAEDVVFIDISYDKQIADYFYDEGFNKGTIAVTDREKLIRYLSILKNSNYNFIFLDVRFEEGVHAHQDTVLADLLKKMPRLLYSKHSNIETNKMFISEKAAINDYFTTITSTNFTRYPFLQNDSASAPLRLYLETHPKAKPIKRHGIFYTCGGSLCQNSPFMTIPVDFKSTFVGTGANFHYLGSDYFDQDNQDNQELRVTDKDMQADANDKIVIIGDFISDLHDTYAGLQPGSFLVYLAYKELVNGKHLLAWPFISFMIIVYFLISIFILNNKSLWDFVPVIKKVKSKLLLFILNLFGYSTVLSIVTILMYLGFRTTYNIVFPSLFFSILSTIISYKKVA